MNSAVWGKPLHTGLFFIAAGYDLNETPKHIKDKQYKDFFRSLGDVLPCFYCRQSYKVFFEALNIDRYMQLPTCGLVRFYYDLRNMINHKLETQEHKALHEEYIKLKNEISPESEEFWRRFREKAQKICYTKPAPAFEKVVEDLYQHRAGCSAHMKTCRKPLDATSFPPAPAKSPTDPNTTGTLDRDLYSGGKRTKRSIKNRTKIRKSRKKSKKVSRRYSRKR